MIHKIKGKVISPDNVFDIGISVDFTANVDQNKVTTDTIVLSREGSSIVKDHIDNVGLFEGIPYDIEYAQGKTLGYYIDMVDGMTVLDNKVQCRIKNRYGHDQFFDRAEDTVFRVVDVKYPFASIDINYLVMPKDAIGQGLTASLGLYVVTVSLASQAKEVGERSAELGTASAPLPGLSITGSIVVTYNTGAIVLASLKLALSLIFFAVLLYQAVILAERLFNLMYPPLRKLKACTALDLMQKSCKYLGYDFKSSILEKDYAKLVILPVPRNRTNIKWYDYLLDNQNKALNDCYPSPSDSTPTVATLIYALEQMFNAKCRVLNGEVQLERWDYWIQKANQNLSSSLVVQADRVNAFSYDFSRLFKRYYIHYQTDFSDQNTLDLFENNLAEYNLDLAKITDPRMNLVKGLKDISIPFALGRPKEKLTFTEKLFGGLFDLLGFNTNLDKRIGALQLTDPFFMQTKMFMWDGKNNLSQTNQGFMHPNYLWDNFHYINNPTQYQYIIKDNVRIKLSGDKFEKILNMNYVNIDGKLCEITKLDYFDGKNYAIISYKEPKIIFGNQLKLTKLY